MGADAEVASAVAQALTGQRLQVVSMAALPGRLAEAGYGPEELATLRRDCRDSGRQWPFPVEEATRRRIGFARFDAALSEVRSLLGVDGLTVAKTTQSVMNHDDRRLAAQRPPHWG